MVVGERGREEGRGLAWIPNRLQVSILGLFDMAASLGIKAINIWWRCQDIGK